MMCITKDEGVICVTTAAATGPYCGSVIVEALAKSRTWVAFVLGDRRVVGAGSAGTAARFMRAAVAPGVRRGCTVGVPSPDVPEAVMARRQPAVCARGKR